MHLQPKRRTGLIVSPKASSSRPKRSELEKSPHFAFSVACFPTQRFTKHRHFDRSEAKWRNPRISLLPLPVFQPNVSQTIVISTEAKRSGEIPAFRFCHCLSPISTQPRRCHFDRRPPQWRNLLLYLSSAQSPSRLGILTMYVQTHRSHYPRRLGLKPRG